MHGSEIASEAGAALAILGRKFDEFFAKNVQAPPPARA
jgi:hypothetical protein